MEDDKFGMDMGQNARTEFKARLSCRENTCLDETKQLYVGIYSFELKNALLACLYYCIKVSGLLCGVTFLLLHL